MYIVRNLLTPITSKIITLVFFSMIGLIVAAGCGGSGNPSAPVFAPAPTPTPKPTATGTSKATATTTPASATATPTKTGTVVATPTSTATSGATPTTTGTGSPTNTPTASPTATVGVGLGKINHIVIAMQENHSFDNYFGALPYARIAGAPGTYHPPSTPAAGATPSCAATDHQCVDGLTCTRAADGTYTCANSNLDCVTADASGNCTGGTTTVPAFHSKNYCPAPDLDHGWTSSHREENFANPNSTSTPSPNDGFARVNDQTEQTDTGDNLTDDDTMGFFNEDDLAFYYGLAETFAINDRYYCDVIGPTTPNRFYLVAGTSFGHVVTGGEELPPNGSVYKPITGTIFDLMDSAGVKWKNYFSDLPTAGDFVSMAGPDAGNFVGPDPKLAQFTADAAAGMLPQVSYVDPLLAGESNAATDEHPPHDIRAGQNYMAGIVNALCYAPGTTSGPCNGASWKDTILLITYDEHGGSYDHATPQAVSQGGALTPEAGHLSLDGKSTAPAIPPGQCADRSTPGTTDTPGKGLQCSNSLGDATSLCPSMTATGPYPAACANFTQTGYRVPIIAVGAFVKQSYVSHVVDDHTSILALIEKRFITGKSLTNRDQNADDLEDMFDFTGTGPSANADVSKLPAAPAANLVTDGNGSCAISPSPSSTPSATPTP